MYTILVIEDNEPLREDLIEILNLDGYHAIGAANGKEGIELAFESLPDLILSDINMPEINGFEVCQQLKQAELTKDIPIILITARAEIDDIAKGFQMGAVDYITKPFQSAELLMRVRNHIELYHKTKQLLELNLTKDKFFSIIAHDLKNPFSALLSSAELLLNYSDRLTTEKKDRLIKSIFENTKYTSNLLDNLLTWARIQTGTILFNSSTINLKELVKSCLENIDALAKFKEITISASIDENIWIEADRNMIQSTLRNLLNNAIKFSNPMGVITIQFNDFDEKMMEIAIIDQGIGISKENQKRLFRLDEHLSTIGTNKEKGTGLGLILCREFMQKNGGTINLESFEMKGTTARITVPKATIENIKMMQNN